MWMSGSPVAPARQHIKESFYAIQHPFTGKMLYPSDDRMLALSARRNV